MAMVTMVTMAVRGRGHLIRAALGAHRRKPPPFVVSGTAPTPSPVLAGGFPSLEPGPAPFVLFFGVWLVGVWS